MPARHLATVAMCLALVSGAAHADSWNWDARFTDASSDELEEVHRRIHASGGLASATGVPVKDVTWSSDALDVRMIDGAVFLEPELEGYAAGAVFVGSASVDFKPESRKSRGDLDYWFGKPMLENESTSFVYFFTLDGRTLLEQLGVAGEPSVAFDAQSSYELSKKALRQMGTSVTHAFLDRDGAAKGAAFVLFSPESIRTPGSDAAHLLYALDPRDENEISLSTFGHEELSSNPDYRYYFYGLTSTRCEPRRYASQGEAQEYRNELELAGTKDAEEVSEITFLPTEGVAALRMYLTPRLEVESVTGPNGESFPFLQWKWLPDRPNVDPYLIVHTGDSLKPNIPQTLTIKASGPIFDPHYSTFYLVSETGWHPKLEERSPAIYDLKVSVPKNQMAVGPGELVSEEVDGGRRKYHFRTSRPHAWGSIYYGDYKTREVKADDTTVEIYANEQFTQHSELKLVATEIANAVKVFNRIFMPLELDHLRVAETPTGHGVGFEGLILLSTGGFIAGSNDTFRAHEVAHQWWGNMVQPANWPEDRWLAESFAEYAAMEYFMIRHQKLDKTRDRIREEWVKPLFRSPEEKVQTLTGDVEKMKLAETAALIDGTGLVYVKGPMVLGMLRYLFEVQQKSDEGFWTLLQDFLDKYRYRFATTEDFIHLTEQHLQGNLDWFWDQWIYGTEIPEVRWSHEVTRTESGDFLLTVNAEQLDTEFVLAIPVYVHMKGGETHSVPLIMKGKEGSRQVRLRSKPSKVSLNDNWEALVRLR